MAKLAWNDFTKKHGLVPAFVARCASRLPPGMVLDGAGKKLPTPYNLLSGIIGGLAKGDWCSMQIKGGVIFKVSTTEDLNAIGKSFKAKPIDHKGFAGVSNAFELNYHDSDYWNFAKQQGFQKEGATLPVQKKKKK